MPRSAARVEEHGPLRLFVAQDVPWPYYARPAAGNPARDVAAVRGASGRSGCRRRSSGSSTSRRRSGRPRADRAGLVEVPLMALERPLDAPAVDARLAAGARRPGAARVARGRGHRVRRAWDGAATTARASVTPRSGIPRGAARAGARADGAGVTVTVVAEDDDGVLAVGSHQPVERRDRDRRRRHAARRAPARTRRARHRRARRRRPPRRRRHRVPLGRATTRSPASTSASASRASHGRDGPAGRVKLNTCPTRSPGDRAWRPSRAP